METLPIFPLEPLIPKMCKFRNLGSSLAPNRSLAWAPGFPKELDTPKLGLSSSRSWPYGCFLKWWVFPQIINLNRVFQYFHHPFWGIPIFGNTRMLWPATLEQTNLEPPSSMLLVPFCLHQLETTFFFLLETPKSWKKIWNNTKPFGYFQKIHMKPHHFLGHKCNDSQKPSWIRLRIQFWTRNLNVCC